MSKISELTTMPLSDLAVYTDYIPVVDSSAGTVKKINIANLQGYTSNANPKLDISSLCSSSYTLSTAVATPLGGRLVMLEFTVHNGTTGIPKTVTNPTEENFLTIPNNIFAVMYTVVSTRVSFAVPPTSAYSGDAIIPVYISGMNLKRSNPTISETTAFIPSEGLMSNGNIKAIQFKILASLKYDTPELPYNS